jgi:serine protease
VSSSYGDIAWTNLPYITDAGANCGANFNGLGADAGITIVEGHEFAETETDQFPAGGWLDNGGQEIGDKCAWNAATSDQAFGGSSFAVQPLWSNAANGGAGGCALS